MNPQEIAPGTPQQQVIERLRTAVNVLVTVSNSPTVDQLAAAIGFTLSLNKLGKHATAVFSGDVPSTLEFLKPETTLEKNTDSLRDFIVSLDKAKADKLRYKVEENVVKIFITPYRTSLSEKDLNFSQGDFNVDAVVALGISEREQLDQAIIAHGRILHDATVITVSAGKTTSTLGAINWQDASASSLSELLVSVGETLQPGLLDNQIATAYLTGIVSQTERFRNDKTTPKVMTIAAQLMAAGANQQLIATSLEQVKEVPLAPAPIAAPATDAPAQESADGSLTIKHDSAAAAADEPAAKPSTVETAEEPAEESAHEEPEPDKTEQIAIDEHGVITPAEAEAKAKKAKRRIVEPITSTSDAEKTSEELFAGGPHPFTANMATDGENEPSTDPLTAAGESDDKLLSHDKDEVTLSTLGPEESTTPAAPELVLPPVADSSTLREIEKNVESPHIAQDPTSTLDEIEQVLESPHVIEAQQTTPPVLDSARDAVQSAIQATPYDANRPAPMQALNASTFDLSSLGGESQDPSSDPVLAGLGLTDNVSQQQPSVLPPAPNVLVGAQVAQSSDQPVENSNNNQQSPPPVPPPMMPLR